MTDLAFTIALFVVLGAYIVGLIVWLWSDRQ